jgi:putative iron-dependent peroxidase
LHDLKGWNTLPTEVQEKIIGRTKLANVELDDAVKPTYAHNALTTIVENGEEQKILRENRPFGTPGQGEFGTYFIGYCRTPRTIEQMLENMFVGRPPGNYDRLLDFSTAVTGLSGQCDRRWSGGCRISRQPIRGWTGTARFAGARRFAWHRFS